MQKVTIKEFLTADPNRRHQSGKDYFLRDDDELAELFIELAAFSANTEAARIDRLYYEARARQESGVDSNMFAVLMSALAVGNPPAPVVECIAWVDAIWAEYFALKKQPGEWSALTTCPWTFSQIRDAITGGK